MREMLIVGVILVFFVSWLIGVVGLIRFSRYIRRTHPKIAEEYFLGILNGSIAQQLRTRKWMKSRGYLEVGDEELNHRADHHSKVSDTAFNVMMGALVILVIAGFFNDSK